MKKLLKQSIAMIMTISTVGTECMLNTYAHDNIDKSKNKGTCFKQCLKYVIPTGIALSAIGYVAGNLLPVKKSHNPTSENDKSDKLFHLFINTNICTDEFIQDYMENQWKKPVKHKKFESYKAKKIYMVKDFYQEGLEEKDNTKIRIINHIREGASIVFTGNIIGENPIIDMAHLIFVMELQKLYPDQVIILKGLNELCQTEENGVPINLSRYIEESEESGLNKQDSIAKIKEFIEGLPVVCEIHDTSNNKKYFFSSTPIPDRSENIIDREKLKNDDFEIFDFVTPNGTIVDSCIIMEKLGVDGAFNNFICWGSCKIIEAMPQNDQKQYNLSL